MCGRDAPCGAPQKVTARARLARATPKGTVLGAVLIPDMIPVTVAVTGAAEPAVEAILSLP